MCDIHCELLLPANTEASNQWQLYRHTIVCVHVCVHMCTRVCVSHVFENKCAIECLPPFFFSFSIHCIQTWNLPSCCSSIDPAIDKGTIANSVFIVIVHALTFTPCALLKFRARSASAHKRVENSCLPVWFLSPFVNWTSVRLKVHRVPTCWVLGSELQPGPCPCGVWSSMSAKIHDDSEIMTAFQILNDHVPVILFNSIINEGIGKKLKLVQKRICFLNIYISYWTKNCWHYYREELFAYLHCYQFSTIYVLFPTHFNIASSKNS